MVKTLANSHLRHQECNYLLNEIDYKDFVINIIISNYRYFTISFTYQHYKGTLYNLVDSAFNCSYSSKKCRYIKQI